MKKSASLLWSLAKGAITVTLIAFIVRKVDFSSLARHLDGSGAGDDAALLGLAFGIAILLSSLPGGVVMLVLGEQARPAFGRARTGPAQ